MVGYFVDEATSDSAWLVRNSWGADWGNNAGYIYLLKGTNVCGVGEQPVYMTV